MTYSIFPSGGGGGQGPAGPPGPPGTPGTPNFRGDFDQSVADAGGYDVGDGLYFAGDGSYEVVTKTFGVEGWEYTYTPIALDGPQGIQGIQGIQGETGPAGPAPDGTGLVYTEANTPEAVTIGSGLTLSGSPGARTLSASGGGAGASIGLYAARPAAGTSGRIYIATDSACAQWVDDGAAWRPIVGPTPTLGVAPPAASGFTKLGGGASETISDDAGSLLVASNTAPVVFYKDIVTSGAYSMTIAFQTHWHTALGVGLEPLFGLAPVESSSGKIARWAIYCDTLGNFTLQYQPHNNPSTPASGPSYSQTAFNKSGVAAGPIWLRVMETGGTRYFQYSMNGRVWVTAYTEPVGTFCTVNRMGVYQSQTNQAFSTSVLSYSAQ